jgi:hypothetical protein
MHQEPQCAVLTNHTQPNERLPGFQSYIVCIAKLGVLRELGRFEGHNAVRDQLQSTIKAGSRVDILESWNPLVQSLMASKLLDGFLGETVFFSCFIEVVKYLRDVIWTPNQALCKTSHECRYIEVIAVVISTIVVVTH